MHRSPQNQTAHDRIVLARAGELRTAGNRVWADVYGYLQPPEIFGHIPDVLTNGNSDILSEVETADSYSAQHTQEQLRAFDRAANYRLEVVVPNAVLGDAKRLIEGVWRVTVDEWRTFSG